MMTFTGKYVYQLDTKNRMRIPKKLRDQMSSGCFITYGDEDFLVVYPNEQKEKLMEEFGDLKPTGEDAELLADLFGDMLDIEEDAQGRFVLPLEYREYASIKKELMIIGSGPFIQIWDKTKYDEKQAARKGRKRNLWARAKNLASAAKEKSPEEE